MMKSRFLTPGFSIILLCCVFSFNSCKKQNSDSDTSVAIDNFTAENESDRITDLTNSAAGDSGVKRLEEGANTSFSVLPDCAHVLLDTMSNSRSIIILFDSTSNGGKGCLCDWDQKYRKGAIIATWSGRYRRQGTIITLVTHNYYVDGTRFDYNKTVTNNGKNAAGNLTFSIHVSLAKITYSDGKTINWTSDRTREWIEGQNTLTPLDDVYSITGSTEGTARNGNHFTATITSPLIFAVGCPWIKQGIIDITPDGKAIRTVDFGNGACDSQATVEIKGVVYNITL